jgi:glycerophosphoryl diester phosphodiesterase
MGTGRVKSPPLVIAHRGASGYLPEHTMEAKALAFGLGADYLEQDVVASRDGQLLVFHDLYLDALTDVAARFPSRARPDGHFYVIDFDLDEIQTLRVGARRDKTGSPIFPERYVQGRQYFRIHTLDAELQMVRELNRQMGRNVGVYPEIKAPSWHRQHGCDLAKLLLGCLAEFGYGQRGDAVFVQCFDPAELSRLRTELRTDLKLIQLIGSGTEDGVDYEQLASLVGLREVGRVVDGVGPAWQRLVDAQGGPSAFTGQAHDLGLVVHPYTFRAEQLPAFSDSLESMLHHFMATVAVDGVFCDFPDEAVRVRDALWRGEDVG